jgi:hypothetical protein
VASGQLARPWLSAMWRGGHECPVLCGTPSNKGAATPLSVGHPSLCAQITTTIHAG